MGVFSAAILVSSSRYTRKRTKRYVHQGCIFPCPHHVAAYRPAVAYCKRIVANVSSSYIQSVCSPVPTFQKDARGLNFPPVSFPHANIALPHHPPISRLKCSVGNASSSVPICLILSVSHLLRSSLFPSSLASRLRSIFSANALNPTNFTG